jgi:hypothetical protein
MTGNVFGCDHDDVYSFSYEYCSRNMHNKFLKKNLHTWMSFWHARWARYTWVVHVSWCWQMWCAMRDWAMMGAWLLIGSNTVKYINMLFPLLQKYWKFVKLGCDIEIDPTSKAIHPTRNTWKYSLLTVLKEREGVDKFSTYKSIHTFLAAF